MKKLAVLIPVFNDQLGLEKTLKSIDGSGLAVWVIDDGSVEAIELNEEYASNVYLVRLEKNVGLVGALNHGLDLIEEDGREYVFRIDAGDLFSFEGVLSRYEKLLSNQVGILGGSTIFIDEKSGSLFKVEKASHNPSRWFPFKVNYVHSGVLFQITNMRYEMENIYCEDIFLFYDIERKYGGLHVVDEPVVVYQGGSGISTEKRKFQLRSLRRNILRRKNLPLSIVYLALCKSYIQEYLIRNKSVEIRLKSHVFKLKRLVSWRLRK